MKKLSGIILIFSLLLMAHVVYAAPCTQGSADGQAAESALSLVLYEGVYDGQTHEGGAVSSDPDARITYSLDDGRTWTDVKPSITDAGTINYSAKAEKAGYDAVYKEGTLTVLPLDVVGNIVGEHSSDIYDGKRHSVEGFSASFSSDLYTDDDFVFSGTASVSRVPVGISEMGLTSDRFSNINPNFNAVFKITDGFQEITAVEEVIVRITGHSNIVTFDGREHRVKGYDVSISNPLYKESFFDFLGTDEIKRTDVGTGYMGLSENDFVNISPKFNKVTFKVTDGYLEVTPGAEAALSILFTSQQYKGEEGAPADLVPQALQLNVALKGNDEEFISEPFSIDTSYFTLKKPLSFKIMFSEGLPDMTGGKYSAQIQGLPEITYGSGSPEGYDQSYKNKYYLSDETWIDNTGTIQVNLLWTRELDYTSEEGQHILPEDAIGAYSIGPDGQKEYVVFQTYAICMNYLGDDELCSSSGRTFNK